MRLILAVTLVVAGLASPANAVTVPTISAPATAAGYQTVTITGTATPGATVQLYESAYQFHDLQPARYWQDGSDAPITTTAGSDGSYRLSRWIDTGFEFAVAVDGTMSRTVIVKDRVVPVITLSTRAGKVTAKVVEEPAQPWLAVQIQRRNSNGTWSVVARGYTAEHGVYSVSFKQTVKKTYTYRAWVSGDSESALLAAYSGTRAITVK